MLKCILDKYEDESQKSILLHEEQALRNLHHENILGVYGVDEDAKGRLYLVTEYMDDGDLHTFLEKKAGPLTVEETAHIIGQVAEGLRYIHDKGIIHRDLKPKNIFLAKSGRVVIGDFGLAKFRDNTFSQASRSASMDGAGTPLYMAPEQWDRRADQRSDLYSLGIIIYQLLTGRLPFTDNLEIAHRRKEPPPLRKFNPGLARDIERVVLKMLEKDPEKRYQNMHEFEMAWQDAITQRALKPWRVDPQHIDPEHIKEEIEGVFEQIKEGGEVRLEAGLYPGPFTLSKRLRLSGDGQSTKLYAVGEPVLHIEASGVRLENMVIQRTPESDNQAVIQAGESVSSYTLRNVTIEGGQADEKARWEDAEWQLPVGGIDFGRISVEGRQGGDRQGEIQLAREVRIEVKQQCTLIAQSNVPELKVFPLRLSPGPHTLKLELHVREKDLPPPGTPLDGSIDLRVEGTNEEEKIHVTGQFEQPAVPSEPEGPPQVQEPSLPPMVWAYRLREEAVRQFPQELFDVKEKNLFAQWNANKRDYKLKQLALDAVSDRLFELVGHRSHRWYVRRLLVKKNEQGPDEEIWELILDIDGENFPSILSERAKTLSLECRVLPDGRGSLKISKVSLRNRDQGVENVFALPALVRLAPAASVPDYQGIREEFIEQIQKLTIKSADKIDEDQLRGWWDLLDFQKKQIEKRQYWVRYTTHDYSEDNEKVDKITFFLDKKDIRNSAQEIITYQDFRSLAHRSRKEKERLKIFSTLPDLSKESGRRKRERADTIGSIEHFDGASGKLEIKLEEKIASRLKNGRYKMPAEGYLYCGAIGDIKQIENQREALDELKQGKATNPLLADFFFNAKKARPIEAIQELSPVDLLSGTCNSGQIDAVEAALATRDLLLIQGPPGTGKTTVIAEICYQVALRGGRTLIASQSNLAVDNALSRLIHHPRVRALRKGNPETVEDEGRAYTEEHIVQKWLSNTAHDCATRLKRRQDNITLFRQLLSQKGIFMWYYDSEVNWDK